MNEAAKEVMRECNNYFAVLCERVNGAQVDAKAVTAPFKGRYTAGDVLRVHGAYTGGFGDFGEGEVYEVVSFADGVLTLDHDLHTKAPYLFIAYCEPPSDFISLCGEIADWQAKNAGRAGLASESIDGYSWSAASDPNGRTGWAAAFADRLKPYRMSRPTVLYYARNAVPWG